MIKFSSKESENKWPDKCKMKIGFCFFYIRYTNNRMKSRGSVLLGFCYVTVPVAVSGTFFAWVFQFTGEMKILEPKWVRERYAGMLGDAIDGALE